MKEIKAIIDPELLSAVMTALHKLPHFPGVTVMDAQGQGRGEGPGGKFVPHGPSWAFSKKIKIEIFCADAQCDEVVDAICRAAQLGQASHGIIRVTNLERVIRTRTGQKQDDAV